MNVFMGDGIKYISSQRFIKYKAHKQETYGIIMFGKNPIKKNHKIYVHTVHPKKFSSIYLAGSYCRIYNSKKST